MCLTNDDIRRPTAALSYGRCRGGMESSPFMTRRTSRIPKKLISALTFVRSWEALYEQKRTVGFF